MAWSDIWRNVEGESFDGEPYRWFFYNRLLKKYDFRGKRVLEIGCGTGISSILMAKAGAKVTFLDNSPVALNIVRKNLDKLSLDGELICENAFHHSFRDEFDVVHSEGVIEHFKGAYRQGIVDAHTIAAKKGGKIVIIVPNLKCPMYRIGKFLSERAGTWLYGNEYPYSVKELEYRLIKSGLDVEMLEGAEFALSLGWVFCPILQKSDSFMKKAISGTANKRVAMLNYNQNPLNWWGSVLGATCRKL